MSMRYILHGVRKTERVHCPRVDLRLLYEVD